MCVFWVFFEGFLMGFDGFVVFFWERWVFGWFFFFFFFFLRFFLSFFFFSNLDVDLLSVSQNCTTRSL